MKLKNLCTIVAATAAFTLAGVAGAAGAQDTYTWVGGTGAAWKNNSNWHLNDTGNPGTNWPGQVETDDQVVINNSGSVTLDLKQFVSETNMRISSLLIDDADLTVLSTDTNGYRLIVDDNLTVEPLGVMLIGDKGKVEVPGSTLIKAGASNTGGRVKLQHNSALLQIGGVLTVKHSSTLGREGRLEIGDGSNGGTVELTDAQTHVIGGFVELKNADSVLKVMDDMTFAPTDVDEEGFITGEHNNAQIRIKEGKKLTSQITVSGNLTIMCDDCTTGTAEFRNEFDVIADSPGGKLLLGVNVDLEDDDNARWIASGNEATLQFDTAVTDSCPSPDVLHGNFEIRNCGVIFVGANLQTTGDLVLVNGELQTATPKEGAVCFWYRRCDEFFESQICSEVGECDP